MLNGALSILLYTMPHVEIEIISGGEELFGLSTTRTKSRQVFAVHHFIARGLHRCQLFGGGAKSPPL